jgi:hypothetical protein
LLHGLAERCRQSHDRFHLRIIGDDKIIIVLIPPAGKFVAFSANKCSLHPPSTPNPLFLCQKNASGSWRMRSCATEDSG